MKTISLAVLESDYEAFRKVAEAEGRSVALMIREAMAAYRVQVLEQQKPLRSLPVLTGHRQTAPLPTRDEIYAEVHAKQ
jgi:hypothetical protein